MIVIQWKTIIMMRQLVTIIVLLTLSNEPALQIQILLTLSIIQQIMMIKYLPFDSKL
jgi:hypothetical protein